MSWLSEWAQKTSCHGIPDFQDSKNVCQKLFWLAVILAAFGAIVFYQTSLVQYFLTVPTATKISKVTAAALPFPVVTVCSQDIIQKQKYEQIYSTFTAMAPTIFPASGNITFLGLVASMALYYPQYRFSLFPRDPVVFNAEMLKYQLLFNNSFTLPGVPIPKYDLVQFLSDISYSCDDIFMSPDDCIFGSLGVECCDCATKISSDLGNCYEMKPVSSFINFSSPIQYQPGIGFGLLLRMRYNTRNSPSFTTDYNIKMTAAKDVGFSLSIGEQMSYIDYARVTVGPGQKVSVNLALNKYIFDPTVSYCVDNSVPLRYTRPGVSTVLLCKQECQVNVTMELCGCSPIFPNFILTSSQLCTPAQVFQCYFGGNGTAYKPIYRDSIFACQLSNCPKLCETNLYVPFAVYTPIQPQSDNYDPNTLPSSAANIYFGELSYTLVVEKPLMDLAGLISGFGGNLGLFAGMSLVTIVQFFAHFVWGCVGLLSSTTNNQHVKVRPTEAENGQLEVPQKQQNLPAHRSQPEVIPTYEQDQFPKMPNHPEYTYTAGSGAAGVVPRPIHL